MVVVTNDRSPRDINLSLGYFSGWPWKKLEHYLNTTNNQRLVVRDLDSRLFAKLMTSKFTNKNIKCSSFSPEIIIILCYNPSNVFALARLV